MKGWIFILFTFLLVSPAMSQVDQTAFKENIKIIKAYKGKLYFGIQNYNLFKNNEFYNNIEPGFTIFGSVINASLKYYPTNTILIEGGIHLLTYYGTGKFDQVTPIIRLQYQPVRNLNIVFGKIVGGLNHGYIEPLYRFERYFEDTPETGLQILFKSNHFDTDLYIDWRKYIYRDSFNEKEVYSLGWVNTIKFREKSKAFQVDLPIQALLVHKGGQVDTTDIPAESILNLAMGISIKYNFNGFISETGATFYYSSYNNLPGENEPVFSNGNAIYPIIYAKSKWINIYLGYWNAYQFIAPLGEPLFSSVSHTDENLTFPERELFIFKLDFHYQIIPGAFIGARYEGYYDILGTNIYENKSQYDSSFGVYINFTRDFFLTDIKKFK
ncbi:MAG: hypothetical protein QNK30_17150 [Bacteroidales bacterium]|nr:hypothetical protein [Bacteroidales bacterium]